MNRKLDNKLCFNIYSWVSFIVFFVFIIFLLFLGISIIFNNLDLLSRLKANLLIPPFLLLIIKTIDYTIKPAYFEAIILNGEIRFRTFSPNKQNKFRFLFMIFYKKELTEHIISPQSYNGYQIRIDRLGLHKILLLQKIIDGKIYQSTPINISLLGLKKYTDLLLSIDRLNQKITLN